MPTWFYKACKRFSRSHSESWQDYLQFSGFRHIKELVSADQILCPNLVEVITDDDWNHNVQADNRIDWFYDYLYLKKRVNFNPNLHNILAIRDCPPDIIDPPLYFENCGFDILDSFDSISVLTNCGQFPDIFHPNEVNDFGLIEDLERANEIADRLRKLHSEDSHCHECKVWQIARYI
jgi:hypothetical protein